MLLSWQRRFVEGASKLPKQYTCAPLLQRDFGAQADGESDELKRVLLEGNPYFLGLTFFVSILHSVFDMLAFKNDIGFWRGKKNVEGLSVRTVGINCVCQVSSSGLPHHASASYSSLA